MGCACDLGTKIARKAIKRSKSQTKDDIEKICGGLI